MPPGEALFALNFVSVAAPAYVCGTLQTDVRYGIVKRLNRESARESRCCAANVILLADHEAARNASSFRTIV
eukprot:3909522-Pleurochrysis_carterae.AAC.1